MTRLLPPTLSTAARLSDVTVALDASTVDSGLHEVNLRIVSGTLTLVRGTRADGTRTLLRTLAGDLPLVAGTAEVANRRFSHTRSMSDDSPAHSRRRVGLVPAGAALFEYLTVAENVALPARLADRRARSQATQVASLCRSVGLGGEFDRLPRDLTASERQRVALAQVLAYDPDLVLLEGDPSSGSDDEVLADVVAALVHLEGRTIVTSVDTRSLADAADQIVRLTGGWLSTEDA